MANIRLENVTKRFGDVTALDDVSLEIKKKGYNVVVGPSGCGKTTLLKVMAGLLKPESGRVLVDGVDVSTTPPEEREIGFFFQNYALFPHMTVEENVGYPLRIRDVPEEERLKRTHEVLEMVGLAGWAGNYPRELSGGMQQRVALARTLSFKSRVLLLDEPLSALDAKIGFILRENLSKLAKKLELTVVHVTPNQEEAMDLGENIIVMRKGKIIQTGTDYEVYTKPATPFTAYFLGESNFMAARKSGEQTGEWNGIKINVDKSLASENVLLSARVEKVLFEKRGKNTFKGVVESINFLGQTIRYEVNVHGKTFVVQTSKHPNIKLGDEVHVHIPPSEIKVFEDVDAADYNLGFD